MPIIHFVSLSGLGARMLKSERNPEHIAGCRI
jgi:hypothetical protein